MPPSFSCDLEVRDRSLPQKRTDNENCNCNCNCNCKKKKICHDNPKCIAWAHGYLKPADILRESTLTILVNSIFLIRKCDLQKPFKWRVCLIKGMQMTICVYINDKHRLRLKNHYKYTKKKIIIWTFKLFLFMFIISCSIFVSSV